METIVADLAAKCINGLPSNAVLKHCELDAVFVPIGMGSGADATIGVRDMVGMSTEVIGVVSSNAPAYALSLAAGHVVNTETAATFADGVATRSPDATCVRGNCPRRCPNCGGQRTGNVHDRY